MLDCMLSVDDQDVAHLIKGYIYNIVSFTMISSAYYGYIIIIIIWKIEELNNVDIRKCPHLLTDLKKQQ